MTHDETYCWYLWKPRVDGGGVRFLHRSDLPQFGFSSVYAVDRGTADALSQSQEISGFKGVVWSSKLWLDCDTEEASHLVEQGLRELGLKFEKWTTGNRGAHFGVERIAAPSQLLPAMDKAWVQARFPQTDLKLYTHLHLFRLPGHTHDKTGRKKALVESVEGIALAYDANLKLPIPERHTKSARDADFGSVFDDDRIMRWSTPAPSGQRHEVLRKLGLRFAERGELFEFAFRWCQHVNMMFSEPKTDEEIRKVLEWAYGVNS